MGICLVHSELEHKISGKSSNIALDLLVKLLGFHSIQFSQVIC